MNGNFNMHVFILIFLCYHFSTFHLFPISIFYIAGNKSTLKVICETVTEDN